MEALDKHSPDSSKTSTEKRKLHEREQKHEQEPPLLAPDQNPFGSPPVSSAPDLSSIFHLQGGSSSMIKEEEPQVSSSVYSGMMEHLVWDTQQLVQSMSPESADLCKNLSSQLEEHFHRDFVPASSFGGESSIRSQMLSLPGMSSRLATSMMAVTSSAVSPDLLPSSSSSSSQLDVEMLKAAIVSHPHYPDLVTAHMNFRRVGAPPEVALSIDRFIESFKDFQPAVTSSIGVNPELDQFMVAYCSMLSKCEKEVHKTFKEAEACCRKLEQQLEALASGANIAMSSIVPSGESDERIEGNESSEEDDSSADAEIEVDPMAKDKKLKEQLMRKYSGYISSLKLEFLKKKKKGKLPKDSTQKLLNWWTLHYKWPYPSEAEKASLAESTGLDQKQINNWFINQRKRHWKPSEDIATVGGQGSSSSGAELTAQEDPKRHS